MASEAGPSNKNTDIETVPAEIIHVTPKGAPDSSSSNPSSTRQSTSANPAQHGTPEVIDDQGQPVASQDEHRHDQNEKRRSIGHHFSIAQLVKKDSGYFRYFKTKEFWIVLLLGQVLSLCITSTNTFSSLLAEIGTSIPGLQTFFNYVLLNIIYTSYTVYLYGWKGWWDVVKPWGLGWKYFLLAFCDVEGNYFTVLAYRYTTILSAQLINFWAIVVVVIVSLIFLRVRYKLFQYLGILICIGGMGLLIGSDHITGANGGPASDELKGDLFALLGASFYGLANVVEEFFVSKRPLYEVIGQMAFWGMLINGTQTGIFDHKDFRTSTWNGDVAGYLVGYTLILSLFYTLAPLLFRLASAAFFNISLLTANFWGVIIGIHVFHLSVHYLYPIAFVLIILGLTVYFLTEGSSGEAKKPWLGENQERGVSGIGTARRKVETRGGPVTEGTPGPGAV